MARGATSRGCRRSRPRRSSVAEATSTDSRESLAEYGGRGWSFSALWPCTHPFTEHYGWTTGAEYHTYWCEPSALGGASPEGGFRRVTADEWELHDPVHRSRADRYALTIERTERWWRERVFDGRSGAPFVYAYERDGAVSGYLAYRIEGEGEERTMALSDHARVDREAFRALCGFCADHDSQVSCVRLRGPTDLGLQALVEDPAEVGCEPSAVAMVRLVDVVPALASLDYSTDGSARSRSTATETGRSWPTGSRRSPSRSATASDRAGRSLFPMIGGTGVPITGCTVTTDPMNRRTFFQSRVQREV